MTPPQVSPARNLTRTLPRKLRCRPGAGLRDARCQVMMHHCPVCFWANRNFTQERMLVKMPAGLPGLAFLRALSSCLAHNSRRQRRHSRPDSGTVAVIRAHRALAGSRRGRASECQKGPEMHPGNRKSSARKSVCVATGAGVTDNA